MTWNETFIIISSIVISLGASLIAGAAYVSIGSLEKRIKELEGTKNDAE